jgi:hypothetical protein
MKCLYCDNTLTVMKHREITVSGFRAKIQLCNQCNMFYICVDDEEEDIISYYFVCCCSESSENGNFLVEMDLENQQKH